MGEVAGWGRARGVAIAYSRSLAAVSRVGSAVMKCQKILELCLPLSTLSVPEYPAYSRVGMLLRGRGQESGVTGSVAQLYSVV